MQKVVIVHLSDIHFSERDFWKGQIETKHGPHRNGHDPAILIALDKKLKSLTFDKIVISGDLTRIGHVDSFGYLKNWLFGNIKAPNGNEIGLNLNEDNCIVVPGNHDCFNGNAVQSSLENYEKFFPKISGKRIVKTQVNGIDINFHLYDSTYTKGLFAKGYIEPIDFLRGKSEDETLDIVVVHHHIIQPPKHKRQKSLELINVDEFLGFLLAENVNAVLFGHTHKRMFETISANILKGQVTDSRKHSRWLRNMLPRHWFSPEMHSLSYNREPALSGRYPSFDMYFEYLYLKNILNEPVMRPGKFKEPHHFYKHIESFRSDYAEKITELRKKKIAFSMSPSPCYSGEHKNGFHLLTFQKTGLELRYDCDYYEWNKNDFVLKN